MKPGAAQFPKFDGVSRATAARTWLPLLSAAMVLVSPVIAIVGFAFFALLEPQGLGTRLRRWLPLGILLSLPAVTALTSSSWHKAGDIVGQALVMVVMGTLFALNRGQFLAAAILVLSSLIVFAEVYERNQESGWSWSSAARVEVSTDEGGTLVRSGPTSAKLYRSWILPGTGEDVSIAASFSNLSREATVRWYGSGERSVSGLEGEPSAVVFTPDADEYIYQSYQGNIAGETFRSTLEVRAGGEEPGCGEMVLVARGFRPNAAVTLCPASEWQEYEVRWTVPEELTATNLDVVIRAFDNARVELRNLRLALLRDGEWADLGALQPNRTELSVFSFRISRLPEAMVLGTPYGSLIDTAEIVGESPTVVLAGEASTRRLGHFVTATLTLPPNSKLCIESIDFIRRDGTRQLALAVGGAPSVRTALWYREANLAGHALAALAVTLAGVAPIGVPMFAAVVLAFILILETGSRTALLIAGLGLLLAGFRFVSRRGAMAHWVFLGSVLLVGCATAVLLSLNGGLESLMGARTAATPRLDAWAAAWRALLSFPITGLDSTFAAHFAQEAESVRREIVAHAHNFWLQYGALYGISGLLAALAFTVGLLVTAHKVGGLSLASVVALVFALQIFDMTLFFGSVLGVLVIAVNAGAEAGPNNEQVEKRAVDAAT